MNELKDFILDYIDDVKSIKPKTKAAAKEIRYYQGVVDTLNKLVMANIIENSDELNTLTELFYKVNIENEEYLIEKEDIKDLTLVDGSVTHLFSVCLPELQKIEDLDDAKAFVIQALNVAKCSVNYYDKMRQKVLMCKSTDSLVSLVNNTIKNGKNYRKN